MLDWMVPRLLLWGTLPAEPPRLREWEREAEVGRAAGAGGLAAGARGSPAGDCAISEEMERGQEMERRIGPDDVGEADGPALTDLIGGFQCTLPLSKKTR